MSQIAAELAQEVKRQQLCMSDQVSVLALPTVLNDSDRIQLRQVILNLLRNASDAMSSVENWPR